MFNVLPIAFREFLEGFIIASVFIGLAKKLHFGLGKISSAIILAFIASWTVAIFSFQTHSWFRLFFANYSDLVVGIISIASSFFIGITIFTLHGVISKYTMKNMAKFQDKVDITQRGLAILAFFFIFKEGLEAIFFNFPNVVLHNYQDNLFGFLFGFGIAMIIGIIVQAFIDKFSYNRMFKIAEVFIIVVGGNMLADGLQKVLPTLNLEPYALPIMLGYIILIYGFFTKETAVSTH